MQGTNRSMQARLITAGSTRWLSSRTTDHSSSGLASHTERSTS